MHSPPTYHRPNVSGILLGIVLALSVRGGSAYADSIESSPFDAESHAQVCKCGSNCREASCCCGRRSASRQSSGASIPGPSPRASEPDPGPCLGEAPCGDPGLPNSTPSGPTSRAATLTHSRLFRPSTTGEILTPPAFHPHHPRRMSRIDRPPRPSRSA